MNDYLDAKISLPTSSVTALNQTDGTLIPNDSVTYTQEISFGDKLTKVDDTPYVPSDKITVRKYRLYKNKEAQ